MVGAPGRIFFASASSAATAYRGEKSLRQCRPRYVLHCRGQATPARPTRRACPAMTGPTAKSRRAPRGRGRRDVLLHSPVPKLQHHERVGADESVRCTDEDLGRPRKVVRRSSFFEMVARHPRHVGHVEADLTENLVREPDAEGPDEEGGKSEAKQQRDGTEVALRRVAHLLDDLLLDRFLAPFRRVGAA